MNEIPNHIAIIMDGNRRWAENKKINKINGHKKGIEIAKNIAIESHKIGVKNKLTRGSKILNLVNYINFSQNFKKKTLSGCIFEKSNKSIIISQEK